MGVPVSNFDDFRAKLKDFSDRSVIFGFLLYDSRPSQKVIDQFAQKQADWIDQLARSAGIYFFFPFRREGKSFDNPSAEILGIFNLGVSRLPGIILFAPPGKEGKISANHAVYIPLEEKDFGDVEVYEPILIDLFELIRESIRQEKSSEAVLIHMKNELSRLRKRRTRRGFAAYIRKGAHLILFEIPKSIYGPFAEGFGKALGGRAAGF